MAINIFNWEKKHIVEMWAWEYHKDLSAFGHTTGYTKTTCYYILFSYQDTFCFRNLYAENSQNLENLGRNTV